MGDYELTNVVGLNSKMGLSSICLNTEQFIEDSTTAVANGLSWIQLFPRHPRKDSTSIKKQISSLVPAEDHHISNSFEFVSEYKD